MKIGEIIYKKRKGKYFSQEQLAELLGVARQTISKWELDETLPDLENAAKLAELLEFSLESALNIDNLEEENNSEWFIIGFAVVGNALTLLFDNGLIGVTVPFIGLGISYIYDAFKKEK